MNNPKVSVIIPVYNAEKHLDRCLNSILTQTLKEIEIICVDDGSIDGSKDILNRFAKIDYRIKIITQPNSGAATARNVGITHAHGEYLSILDSDDFFDKCMLEKMYNKCVTNDLEIVICKVNLYDDKTKILSLCNWAIRDELRIDKNIFSGIDMQDHIFQFANGWAWDKMFKREFVMENKLEFQNTKVFNDAFFVFMAMAQAQKMSIIDEVLATKRREVATSISALRSKNWFEYTKLIFALEKALVSRGIYNAMEKSFINYALHLPMYLLKSISSFSQIKLLLYLKYIYFPKLKFKDYAVDYFYNQSEYEKYKVIYDKSIINLFFRFMRR